MLQLVFFKGLPAFEPVARHAKSLLNSIIGVIQLAVGVSARHRSGCRFEASRLLPAQRRASLWNNQWNNQRDNGRNYGDGSRLADRQLPFLSRRQGCPDESNRKFPW